jgi:hypothetical protein
MKDAFALSATSEATGFPKENLVDWNPDTYWKPTAVGTVSFKIDLTTVKTVKGWAVWIHNVDVALQPGPGTQQIKVYYSSNDSTYTLWDTLTLPDIYTQSFTQNIMFGTLGLTQQSYRYWKFEIIAPDQIVEISIPFLWTNYAITQGNQTPQSDQQTYLTRKTESASGRVYTQLIRTLKREVLNRQYLFVTGGAWETLPLVLAWNDCRGDWRPLILVEDATPANAKLVRFASPQIERREVVYQVYSAGVSFATEPAIAPGATI